jgi:hypothetical protein
MGRADRSQKIGATRAFVLLWFLGVVAPWFVVPLLVIATGGALYFLFALAPKLLVAGAPFILGTTDKWRSVPLLPLPTGLLLTAIEWAAISVGFAFVVQNFDFPKASMLALALVALVWAISFGVVVLLNISGPQLSFRT